MIVQWSNSSPTVHGPFESFEDADDWARHEELATAGVTRADAAPLGKPELNATGWQIAQRRQRRL